MRYVGIDHGSRAFRVVLEGHRIEIPREEGAWKRVLSLLEREDMVVLSYSMGDALQGFTPLRLASDLGVVSVEGAGLFTGEGTKLVRALKRFGKVYLVPGIHRGLRTLWPAFRILYSHCGSGDKIMAVWRAMEVTGWRDFILMDVSTNTVSVLVRDGRVVGGLDACVCAPGFIQGPLDLEGIRLSMRYGANEVFSKWGIMRPLPLKTSEKERIDALITSLKMECSALMAVGNVNRIVLTGWGVEKHPEIHDAIKEMGETKVMDRFSSAEGGASLARKIDEGADEIMGIPVIRD